MRNTIGSLHLAVTRAVAAEVLTAEEACQLHDLLNGRSNPTELVVLKFAAMHARQTRVLSDDQIARLFDLIPELGAA